MRETFVVNGYMCPYKILNLRLIFVQRKVGTRVRLANPQTHTNVIHREGFCFFLSFSQLLFVHVYNLNPIIVSWWSMHKSTSHITKTYLDDFLSAHFSCNFFVSTYLSLLSPFQFGSFVDMLPSLHGVSWCFSLLSVLWTPQIL